MTENKGKWASRHRKIEKLGCQAAAKIISFPRRWHGGMISANQEAIWGMSVECSRFLFKRGRCGSALGELFQFIDRALNHVTPFARFGLAEQSH